MKLLSPKNKHMGMTMTVGELILALQKYDSDMPVIATWEGKNIGILEENFYLEPYKGKEDWLIIDVDSV